MEELSRFERIEATVNLKEVDRVPADPLNIYILGYQGGISLKERARKRRCRKALHEPRLDARVRIR